MRFTGPVAIAVVSMLAACAVVAGDHASDEGPLGNEPELDPPPACVLARGEGVVAGDVHDESGTAEARATGEGCARQLTIESSAPRRDDLPAGPRALVERADRPSLQTRNVMFDALYQLALEEAAECSV